MPQILTHSSLINRLSTHSIHETTPNRPLISQIALTYDSGSLPCRRELEELQLLDLPLPAVDFHNLAVRRIPPKDIAQMPGRVDQRDFIGTRPLVVEVLWTLFIGFQDAVVAETETEHEFLHQMLHVDALVENLFVGISELEVDVWSGTLAADVLGHALVFEAEYDLGLDVCKFARVGRNVYGKGIIWSGVGSKRMYIV